MVDRMIYNEIDEELVSGKAEPTMIDGIELGERCYKKMTEAWLDAASIVFALDGDKKALKEFRAAFGRNPAHIKKAVERFPEVWTEDGGYDLFDILATIHLSKIKDDNKAIDIFEEWTSDTSLDYDRLKFLVKEATTAPHTKRNGHGDGDEKTCERCEAVRQYLDGASIDDPNWNTTIYSLLARRGEKDAK